MRIDEFNERGPTVCERPGKLKSSIERLRSAANAARGNSISSSIRTTGTKNHRIPGLLKEDETGEEDEGENGDRSCFQCLAINITPEPVGEAVCISGERDLIEDLFPEIREDIGLKKGSVIVADSNVIRFPLNGYCKLTALETITRLLNNGFRIMASSGGGFDKHQLFSEHLLIRKIGPGF